MTINPITVYYCPGCTAAYATAAEALACGGGETARDPEPHVVWPCRREDCEVWLHDSEEEARECAAEEEQKVTPKQTTVYRCNRCGFLYRNQREAEECCPVMVAEHWDCGRESCPGLAAALPHRTMDDARKCAAEGEQWLPPTAHVPLAALEWLFGRDTGLSSECIWRTMTGVPEPEEDYSRGAYPMDAFDFGRCVRLLEAVPEWRSRLGEMRQHGADWSALVDEWDSLTALYRAAEKAVASRPLQMRVTPEELDFCVAIRQCTETAREKQR